VSNRAKQQTTALTQDAAAELLGVTGRTVSRWETGGTVGQPELFAALAAYREHQRQTGRLVGANGSDGHVDAMSWERVVATDAAEDWLDGYRKRLRRIGLTPEDRDTTVSAMRRAGLGLSGDGPNGLWTVQGAVDYMDRLSKHVLQVSEAIAKSSSYRAGNAGRLGTDDEGA
jgi:transcriptional regulator with XRE-family HTH domain